VFLINYAHFKRQNGCGFASIKTTSLDTREPASGYTLVNT